MPNMKILGIESSCDETSAAVVEDGVHILSNVVSSQIDIHARFGGIVPEVASRQHLLAIIPTIDQAMQIASVGWDKLDAIAVTNGPGLAGSLLVGVSVAKSISFAHNIRLIAVNHLEGHIYANWLSDIIPEFPLLCLIVSGGHTDLVAMKKHGDYTVLGHTLDDAAGEAFDKAARILGLGYPGGPAIDNASRIGHPCLDLPQTWLQGTNNFSFSGIKTALLRLAETGKIHNVNDAAASFQQNIVTVLTTKTINAAIDYSAHQIILSGGVASNRLLRQEIKLKSPIPVIIPPPVLCTDNAAMIASCAYFKLLSGKHSSLDMDVIANLQLTSA